MLHQTQYYKNPETQAQKDSPHSLYQWSLPEPLNGVWTPGETFAQTP